MNRKDTKKIMVIICLILLGCMSIGFAAFSTTLSINISGGTSGSKYDIHFDSLIGTGTGYVTGNEQSLVSEGSNTIVDNLSVEMTKVGTYVDFVAVVHNDGDYDAHLDFYDIKNDFTCSGGSIDDNNTVCSHLDFSLFSYSGDDLISYPKLDGSDYDEYLAAGESKTIVFRVEYDKDELITTSDLPKNDILVSNLGFTLVYNVFRGELDN